MYKESNQAEQTHIMPTHAATESHVVGLLGLLRGGKLSRWKRKSTGPTHLRPPGGLSGTGASEYKAKRRDPDPISRCLYFGYFECIPVIFKRSYCLHAGRGFLGGSMHGTCFAAPFMGLRAHRQAIVASLIINQYFSHMACLILSLRT